MLDNFFTGTKENLMHWFGHPNFELIRHDVVDPIMIECDRIYHLACPASPPHYQYNSIKTVKTSFLGTLNMLGLAKRVRARFLLTSTSGACIWMPGADGASPPTKPSNKALQQSPPTKPYNKADGLGYRRRRPCSRPPFLNV